MKTIKTPRFAKALRVKLTSLGISDTELADSVGISNTVLGQYKKNKTQVGPEAANKIIRFRKFSKETRNALRVAYHEDVEIALGYELGKMLFSASPSRGHGRFERNLDLIRRSRSLPGIERGIDLLTEVIREVTGTKEEIT